MRNSNEDEVLDLKSGDTWRALLEAAPQIHFLINPKGICIYVSRTEHGYSMEQVLGQHIRDFSPPEVHGQIDEMLEHVFERGTQYQMDIPIEIPDGGVRIYRETIAPFVRDGTVIAAIGSTYDATETKQVELLRRRFTERVVAAQELERGRIARELHDGIAQSLSSILLGLKLLQDTGAKDEERLHELRSITRKTLDDLNRIVRGLHPVVLEDLGLETAIEHLISDLGTAEGLTIDFQIRGLREAVIPKEVELCVYRILQEAARNTRHAHAQRVSVVVERKDRSLHAIVEDDGCGFDVDPHGPISRNDGMGITSIRERAQQVGGTVTFESSPGRGTSVFVRIPLAP